MSGRIKHSDFSLIYITIHIRYNGRLFFRLAFPARQYLARRQYRRPVLTSSIQSEKHYPHRCNVQPQRRLSCLRDAVGRRDAQRLFTFCRLDSCGLDAGCLQRTVFRFVLNYRTTEARDDRLLTHGWGIPRAGLPARVVSQ